jgi:hypothetical protein
MNYLSPTLRDTPWTPEEDRLLVQKHRDFGSKWVQIALFFPNRTDAMIKNRFNRLRRRERKHLELLARQDMRLFSFVQSERAFPIAAQAKPTKRLLMPTPEPIRPVIPEPTDSPVWDDELPFVDCFVDPFAWI